MEQEPDSDNTSPQEELHLFAIGEESRSNPIRCEVRPVAMVVDTGAEVSLISDQTSSPAQGAVESYFKNLYRTENASGGRDLCPGTVWRGDKTNAFDSGCRRRADTPGARLVEIDWKQILSMAASSAREWENAIVLFSRKGYRHCEDPSCHVESQQKFCKARPVPFAIKDAVGAELDRLEAEGIVERVSHSDWAAPIVVVPKKDGRFRICGDYKVTVNPVMEVDQYSLPNPADMFATLAGGQKKFYFRPHTGIPAADLGRGLQEVYYSQHSPRIVSVDQASIRHSISPVQWISFCRVFQRYNVTLMIF